MYPIGDFGLEAGGPLAFVELDRVPELLAVDPPSFPVIGLGDAAHPAAGLVDTVVEAPVSAEALALQILRNPRAAEILVRTLRISENLAVADALALESLSYGILQGSSEFSRWLASNGAMAHSVGNVRVVRNNGVLRIVLNNPANRNAIDRTMRDALYEAFSLAAIDPDIARVELRAAGPAFSIGGDLGEFGTTRDPADAHHIRSRTLPAIPLSRCADKVEVHVQGACIGAGLEMAAFAGRVTAAPNAWFQLPELAMGLIPGAGGCVSVPRRIGRRRAALMILSGRRIGARTALDWGLIDAIEDRPPIDPDAIDADLR